LTILTTIDIAPPAKKSIQETDHLIRVQDPLPVLHQVMANVSTIPVREPTMSFQPSLNGPENYLPIPVYADLIKFFLGAITVPLLSKLRDI
jgi:hypothetical protein